MRLPVVSDPTAPMAGLSSEGASSDPSSDSKTRARHVYGLDSLRFVLAAWVMFGHFGASPIRDVLIALHSPRPVRGIPDMFFNGAAAVMPFFVISGFCIHLPYTRPNNPITYRYFVRREVRILPPVLVMLCLSWMTNNWLFVSGCWSLICEEVYYILYPFFRSQIKPDKMRLVVGVCLVIAGITIALKPHAPPSLMEQGAAVTWLMFAPLWVLGAFMAELYSRGGRIWARMPISRGKGIWLWRGGIVAASIAQKLAGELHPTSNYILIGTLLAFGIVSVFWLDQEIHYYQSHVPVRWIEAFGLGSYSLYLTHPFIVQFATDINQRLPSSKNALYAHHLPSALWFLGIVASGIFAATIYFLVERPSHRLARRLGTARSS
jgi:peptidoglycan/LPS O-acetylase OafA/YrhL